MNNITPQKVHTFCRTCLMEMKEKFSIYDNANLGEIITFCTSKSVEIKYKLPEFVCKICYEKLVSFYDFRCQSMQSICILNNIINELKEERVIEDGKIPDRCQRNGEYFNGVEGKKAKPLKNFTVKTNVEISEDPIDCTVAEVQKSGYKKDLDEMEINLSDIKLLSGNNAVVLNSFETPINDVEAQKPLIQEAEYGTVRRKKNYAYSGLSTESSTKRKSERSRSINAAPKFRCEKCPRRCATYENYEAHLRTHQGLKPFVCQECGHSFNKADRCRAHVREVHALVALQYNCSYEGCDKVYRSKGTYEKHYRLKHKYPDREPKNFICEECGSTFKSGTRLKQHRYKHLPVDQYPFKCEECGKQFTSKRTFKEHQLRHSGIKKYICPYCGMKKPTKNELRIHVQYHTKEKQSSCSKCSSVFSTAANLRRHDRVVHQGIRQYVCSYCKESFAKQETLKHHEMRHTGEKPHGCNICGKRFIQAVALRTHLRVHTKNFAGGSIKPPSNKKLHTLEDKIEKLTFGSEHRNDPD